MFGTLASLPGTVLLFFAYGAGPALLFWIAGSIVLITSGMLIRADGSSSRPLPKPDRSSGPYRPKPYRPRLGYRLNPFTKSAPNEDDGRTAGNDQNVDELPAEADWPPRPEAALPAVEPSFARTPMTPATPNSSSDRRAVRVAGSVLATGLLAASLSLPMSDSNPSPGIAYLILALWYILLVPHLFGPILAIPVFLTGLVYLGCGNGHAARWWGAAGVILGSPVLVLGGLGPGSIAWCGSMVVLAATGVLGGSLPRYRFRFRYPRPGDRPNPFVDAPGGDEPSGGA